MHGGANPAGLYIILIHIQDNIPFSCIPGDRNGFLLEGQCGLEGEGIHVGRIRKVHALIDHFLKTQSLHMEFTDHHIPLKERNVIILLQKRFNLNIMFRGHISVTEHCYRIGPCRINQSDHAGFIRHTWRGLFGTVLHIVSRIGNRTALFIYHVKINYT